MASSEAPQERPSERLRPDTSGPRELTARDIPRTSGLFKRRHPSDAVPPARRWLARALCVIPALVVVAIDARLRWNHLVSLGTSERTFYLACAGGGLLLWTSLFVASSAREGAGRWVARAALAALALFTLGAQAYTYARYHAFMDHQAVLVGTTMLPSIGQQLWIDRATFALTLLPPLAVALALPVLLRRLAPTTRTRGRGAIDLALVVFLVAALVSPKRGGEQGQPPDIMYVAAMGQLARARWDHNEQVERVHPERRSPLAVPPLVAMPPARRNVVLIVTESVRASSVCLGFDKDCRFTPFTNEALPSRLPLRQMRATDSTTAISLAVLWSGLRPDESRANLHSAPLVWEYAHAAGMATAYWTSQNLLFGNSGAWIEGLPLTRHVSATHIESDSTMEVGADDGKMVDRALAEMDGLREPYVAVVHLSNTHFPYKIDPELSPYGPDESATGWGDNDLLERYQDAIYLQDRAVARLAEGVRRRPGGERAVLVFVSDHGEQLRERGGVGHTGTLYDEEIHIPAWIDAPPGTLTEVERQSLQSLENTPLTSLDVMPTLLDLIGVWDAPGVTPFRQAMTGHSLLRGGSSPEQPVFLTNCTELWQCAFKNWGAIRGTHKLIASQGDHTWNCFDVASDPLELTNLGPAACGDLLSLAEARGRGRPF